jgi:hypothetical protein
MQQWSPSPRASAISHEHRAIVFLEGGYARTELYRAPEVAAFSVIRAAESLAILGALSWSRSLPSGICGLLSDEPQAHLFPYFPCRCLCFGFLSQMMKTRFLRRTAYIVTRTSSQQRRSLTLILIPVLVLGLTAIGAGREWVRAGAERRGTVLKLHPRPVRAIRVRMCVRGGEKCLVPCSSHIVA